DPRSARRDRGGRGAAGDLHRGDARRALPVDRPDAGRRVPALRVRQAGLLAGARHDRGTERGSLGGGVDMSSNTREGTIVAARARREPGTAATAKRNQVVRQAAALFDDAGYHNTGVADIAAAAGISKPTLYHYFASKDEILFWIHEEYMDELIARQERRAHISISPSTCLLELMSDMLQMTET